MNENVEGEGKTHQDCKSSAVVPFLSDSVFENYVVLESNTIFIVVARTFL